MSPSRHRLPGRSEPQILPQPPEGSPILPPLWLHLEPQAQRQMAQLLAALIRRARHQGLPQERPHAER